MNSAMSPIDFVVKFINIFNVSIVFLSSKASSGMSRLEREPKILIQWGKARKGAIRLPIVLASMNCSSPDALKSTSARAMVSRSVIKSSLNTPRSQSIRAAKSLGGVERLKVFISDAQAVDNGWRTLHQLIIETVRV